MDPQTTLNPCGALEGFHGVHLASRSPFGAEEIPQHGELDQSISEGSAFGSNQKLLMQRIWQQRPPCLRPIHCNIQGDHNLIETIANVFTSLPFIALGIHAPRKNMNSKIYANSLIGVGVASSLYHSSRGELRKYLRWVDYTMIATATVCLSSALRNENPKLLMAASAVFLPFQPLMVSAVHTGLMEFWIVRRYSSSASFKMYGHLVKTAAFAERAFKEPDLRMTHNLHKISSLLSGALFIADDVFPRTPYLHAAWHLAAALGVGTCNKLLE